MFSLQMTLIAHHQDSINSLERLKRLLEPTHLLKPKIRRSVFSDLGHGRVQTSLAFSLSFQCFLQFSLLSVHVLWHFRFYLCLTKLSQLIIYSSVQLYFPPISPDKHSVNSRLCAKIWKAAEKFFSVSIILFSNFLF